MATGALRGGYLVDGVSTGPARQRVARLLMRLVHNRVGSECELFCREDMGVMLEITTETTSRIIAEYKKRWGLLLEAGINFFLLDVPGLRRIAED